MIYENRRRSTSNDPFPHFCGYYVLCHCVKSVDIRSFSGPHIAAFGLSTERWLSSLRILPEWSDQGTDQKNSKYGHFSRSLYFDFCFCSLLNASLYCNNIESHPEKNGKYYTRCEALLIGKVFENIFWQYFRELWRGS